jgi:proteasome lid subunit RPN8/RPN11
LVLNLASSHLNQIYVHAEHTYPHECCGLLLGKLSPVSVVIREILEVWKTENTWTLETDIDSNDSLTSSSKPKHSLKTRYQIAPISLLKAQQYARDRDLSIIGIYHSHPDHPAIPSECDRVCAWPHYSYLIVSVNQGTAGDVKSWCLDPNHNFQSEEIMVLNHAYETDASSELQQT